MHNLDFSHQAFLRKLPIAAGCVVGIVSGKQAFSALSIGGNNRIQDFAVLKSKEGIKSVTGFLLMLQWTANIPTVCQ